MSIVDLVRYEDGRIKKNLGFYLAPHVEQYLVRGVNPGEDEMIIDEVRKHWIKMFPLVIGAVLCIGLIGASCFFGLAGYATAAFGVIGALYCIIMYHARDMDRFVITNQRAFRVTGIFMREVTTTPLAKIVDIRMTQNVPGRILRYGSLSFASAAEKKISMIKYVPRPEQRDKTIQAVLQHAGARQMARWPDEGT